MHSTRVIKWLGCWTGIIGAGMLALRSFEFASFGWLFFLASNLFWITAAFKSEDSPLGFQNYAYMVTTLIGINEWLLPESLKLVLPL